MPNTQPAASRTAVSLARTALDEHGTAGEFKRRDAAWRNWVQAGELLEKKSVIVE